LAFEFDRVLRGEIPVADIAEEPTFYGHMIIRAGLLEETTEFPDIRPGGHPGTQEIGLKISLASRDENDEETIDITIPARLDSLADIEKSVRDHEYLLDEIDKTLSGKKRGAV
jgi:hypothetical protein